MGFNTFHFRKALKGPFMFLPSFKNVRFQNNVNKSSKGDKSKRYTKSLNLPQTLFPLTMKEGVAVEREFKIQKEKSFQTLYAWQQCQSWDKTFILHDGPPYANGKLHVGHAVNKILKDILNRFKVMTKHKVHYVPGWDCHGMPIEIKAVTDKDGYLQKLSPLEIRRKARSFAENALKDQRVSFKNWGIMANWEDIYKTLDFTYEAKQLEIFYQIYEKGFMYRDYMPVYWSPSSQTALAEAELEYNRDHVSKSVYIKFPLVSLSSHFLNITEKEVPIFAVVWTTTPWTLPFNQAICYNSKLKYSLLKDSESKCYYICEDAFVDTLKSIIPNSVEIKGQLQGSTITKSSYRHPLSGEELQFLPGDHVTTGKGTGFVHTAPAHGHDDFLIAVKHNLPRDCHVDEAGRYISGVDDSLLGKTIGIDADEAVLKKLSEWILKVENYTHSYPYDWRTKKPVIIRASKQWFIDTVALQELAIESLNEVEILPKQSERGMLAEIKSRPYWCISRQRVWGVPIPVFYHADTKEPLVSKETVEHLRDLTKQHGSDFWWKLPMSALLPDDLLKKIGKGTHSDYVKGQDILDIWFDSGISWAVVLNDVGSQADVYLEGIDQFKGWFQTSLLTKVALDKKAPYRKIITHGFATDEEGKKMSKSLGNIIDPEDIVLGGKDKRAFPSYGVDVLRWWVAHSHHHTQIMIGQNILHQMNEDLFRVRKCLRHLLGNLHDFDPAKHLLSYSSLPMLDKYMLHVLYSTISQIISAYESYSYQNVIRNVEKFVNADLSSFYFKVTRDRCYCSEKNNESRRASQTVQYHTVQALMSVLAPIIPHMAEEAYRYCPGNPKDIDSIFKFGLYEMDGEWNNVKAVQMLLPVFEMRQKLNEEFGAENLVEYDILIYSSPKLHDLLREIQPETQSTSSTLCEIFQTSHVTILDKAPKVIPEDASIVKGNTAVYKPEGSTVSKLEVDFKILIIPAECYICERCRKYTAVKYNVPCDRCLATLADGWST